MTTFSPSDAALEGFQVIRRHWRVVAGWAGFNLLALVGLCVLMVVVLLGTIPFAGSRELAGATGAVIGAIVLGLGSIMVELVIFGGLLRLMLRPQEPAFLHLRLGRDEFRLLAVAFAILMGMVVVGTAVFVVLGLLKDTPGIVRVAAALVLFAAFYVALLRVSVAPVMTFAERRLRLAAGWRLTRGHTWRLVGMGLLLLCLIALIEVVGWLVLTIGAGSIGGFRDLGLGGAEGFAQHPGRYVVKAVLQILAAPFLLVIAQAPWVAVYRALTGAPAEDVPAQA